MKQGLWVLAALAAGIAVGTWLAAAGAPWMKDAAQIGVSLGQVWLDALRMTLVPLIVSILITAIAAMAESAAAGPLARRALAVFAVLIVASACYAIPATHALLAWWPIAPGSAEALLAGSAPTESAAPAASGAFDLGRWAQSLVPSNVVAAAAEDAVAPLVVFACLFGFAATRLDPAQRAPLLGFFQGLSSAMLVIVGWVLALAPVGVFGLSLSLGLSAGLEAFGALAHYVAIVSIVTIGVAIAAILLGMASAAVSPIAYLRGTAPVIAVAASTQSSLASLPAMLTAATERLNIAPRTASFVLPLAVAVFRMTSPAANLAVVVFLAHLYGVDPSLPQWAAAIAVAFAVSVSSVGLPGQTSFFASVAPICLTVGLPVTALPLLLAVEVIPDVFRTIGNVTADVGATSLLDADRRRSERRSGAAEAQ